MIEIVLRKIEESGDVSEIILALLPTVGTIDSDHSMDVIAFPGLVIRMKEQTEDWGDVHKNSYRQWIQI